MENLQTNPTLNLLIAEGTAKGIYAGLLLFCQNERIPSKPTEKSANPFDDAILILTAEFTKDKQNYPFDESIRDQLINVVTEYIEPIGMMWNDRDAPGELAKLNKFLEIIICGQTLEFLKKREGEVRALFEGIRKNGLVLKELPSHGPGG